MAAIPAVQSVSTVYLPSATGDLVIPKPTGTTFGDFLVVFVSAFNRSVTGWNLFTEEIATGNSTNNFFVGYRFATSSEPADYTFGMSGTNDTAAGIVRIDNASKFQFDGSEVAFSATTPTFSTGWDNCLLLAPFAVYSNPSIVSPNEGWQEAWDLDGGVIAQALNYRLLENRGMTPEITWSSSGSNRPISAMLAVRPPLPWQPIGGEISAWMPTITGDGDAGDNV